VHDAVDVDFAAMADDWGTVLPDAPMPALRRKRQPRRVSAGDFAVSVKDNTAVAVEKQPAGRMRPKAAGQHATEGDTVTWRLFTLSSDAAGYRESTVEAGGGVVQSVTDEYVMVRCTTQAKRKALKIPRVHITSRVACAAAAAAADTSPPNARAMRKKQRVSPAPQSQPLAPSESASAEARLLYRCELAEYKLDEQRRATETAQHATRNERRRTVAEVARVQQLSRKVVNLGAKIDGLKDEVNELKKSQPSDMQPLGGMTVDLKAGRGGGGKEVPVPVRDMCVDLQAEFKVPGGVVFDVIDRVCRGLGAVDVIKPVNGYELCMHALLERSTLLLDDQVRRMAEETRTWTKLLPAGSHPPGEGQVCGERKPYLAVEEMLDRKLEERAAQQELGTQAAASWISKVHDRISPWMEKIDYKSNRDAPNPTDIDVGPLAETAEDFDDAWCGVLFGGVDGTTHGRYALLQHRCCTSAGVCIF
jgi:hypothetical protein